MQASEQFLQLARIGRAPGQLAYAVAALIAPSLTERRLERIEPDRTSTGPSVAGSGRALAQGVCGKCLRMDSSTQEGRRHAVS